MLTNIPVRANFGAMLLGAAIGIVALSALLPELPNSAAFEDLALGLETHPFYARFDGHPVHCKDLTDVESCLSARRESGIEDVVLWLGNSQLHAVNQLKAGETSAADRLHRWLRTADRYLMVLSQPNANLQEHYLLLEYLSSRDPVKTLILPLVFDDMREDGIRPSLSGMVADPLVFDRLSITSTGRALRQSHENRDLGSNDMSALRDTPQEIVEKHLNDALADYWTVWRERPWFRGQIYNGLYLFRNTIFGIKASSIRKVIPGRYAMNRQALKDMLDVAASYGIFVYAYIAPLRNDVTPPYDPSEYALFKKDMSALLNKPGAAFLDLENLVPGSFWGQKEATTLGGQPEVDFMHFQAPGHALLAQALWDWTRFAAK